MNVHPIPLIATSLALICLVHSQQSPPVQNPQSNTPPPPAPGVIAFRRGFVEADRDIFDLSGSVSYKAGGKFEFKGQQIQYFKKVEKGEAELTILTSLKVRGLSGDTLWEESNRLSKARFNAYGIIISPEKVAGNEMAIANILEYGMLIPYKGLKPEGPQKFDYRQAENTEYYIRGTFEKESATEKEVVIKTKVEFFNNQTSTPVRIESRTTWDLVIRRATSIELTARDLPQNPGSKKFESVTINAKRVQPTAKKS